MIAAPAPALLAPAPAPSGGGRRFLRGLADCERLLARHLAGAVQRFGAAALDVVDLPALSAAGSVSTEQVRAAATLLWTCEVEQAGLPGFVDALADGVVTGRVFLPLTSGGDVLASYWHARRERFAPAERAALYERLFGRPDDAAHPFRRGMEDLCQGLAAIGQAPRTVETSGLQVRVQLAGRELAQHLSEQAAGIGAYAARELVGHVKAALQVLRDRDVALALGGGGPWRMIETHAPQVLGREIDPVPHLDRAAAGLTLVTWLADAAAAFDAGTAVVTPEGPEVHAAELWLAAAGRP
jgi:hypothetical protein